MTRHFPAGCFWLNLLGAVGLLTLVALAPRYAANESSLSLRLFAQDETLRKVALAAAAGLATSGIIFFRPNSWRLNAAPKLELAPVTEPSVH